MSSPERHERVELSGRPTDIEIGHGVRERLWSTLRALAPRAQRCGIVIDEHVQTLWPLVDTGEDFEPVACTVPRGEKAKDRQVLGAVQDALIDLRRDEPVVVVGGGATLDVGGFAAATLRRGLTWLAVPTTLIGMADAAVGGKVAVNHPRGKNLLGTFHPPRHVLADVAYLETLDERDRVSGLAELYKCACVGDTVLLETLGGGAPRETRAWIEAIGRAVAVKARIVERDERDEGERRLLNYGHTVGHALERLFGNEAVRHGEAVAIGMQAAARLSRARNLIGDDAVERQTVDLRRLQLPVALPDGVDPDAVLASMQTDKKRRSGATHTFVLPAARELTIVDDVTDDEVRAAL